MATDLDKMWELYFPGSSRPESYSGDALENEFRPLTKPEDFYKDTAALTSDQLYCLAANNQEVLQTLQLEFSRLENTINGIKHKEPLTQPPIKNPQLLPARDVCEERKEALLYGYKYDPKRPMAPNFAGVFPTHLKDLGEVEKHDLRMQQDPWTQGGFVPGKRQYEALKAKAKDPHNPDGWEPILHNGHQVIPKPYTETNDDKLEKFGARSAAIQAVQSSLPTNGASLEDLGPRTRRGTPNIVNKPLRSTRFNGSKVPVTRDPSEAPSFIASRASTPKRKRADTPLATNEPIDRLAKKPKITQSPPVKRKGQNQYTKAKRLEEERQAAILAGVGNDVAPSAINSVSTTATNTPQPKKRHNQYTKARERAEQASASIEPSPPRDRLASTPSILESTQPEEQQPLTPSPIPNLTLSALPLTNLTNVADAGNEPFWMSLSADEKFAYHGWKLEDLLACIRYDHSWVAGPFRDDQAQNDNIRDMVLNAQHPTRAYAAKRNWLEMKNENRHLRGPRKNKKNSDNTTTSITKTVAPAVGRVETTNARPPSRSASTNATPDINDGPTMGNREKSNDSLKERKSAETNSSQEKVNGMPEPMSRPRRSVRK